MRGKGSMWVFATHRKPFRISETHSLRRRIGAALRGPRLGTSPDGWLGRQAGRQDENPIHC